MAGPANKEARLSVIEAISHGQRHRNPNPGGKLTIRAKQIAVGGS
jgi:hypothetical protein